MYYCKIGAIFALFIFCGVCENIDDTDGFVPSAPQNLTVNQTTSFEIHLSWVPPNSSEPRRTILSQKPQEPQSDQSFENNTQNGVDTVGYAESKEFPYDSNETPITLDRKKRFSRNHNKRRPQRELDENALDKNIVSNNSRKNTGNHGKIAFVLYYTQGKRISNTNILGSVDWENEFVVDDRVSNPYKNLTLFNKADKPTKVVGFRLKQLSSRTPYKIFVKAFYYHNDLGRVKSADIISKLSNESNTIYVLTDVGPPGPPQVLNLTCDQPKGILYLQWLQPSYENSLDQYIVTLWKLQPLKQLMVNLTLTTNKDEIETTISLKVALGNNTRYAVHMYAQTKSIIDSSRFINGVPIQPEEISSTTCVAHSELLGRLPVASPASGEGATLALLAGVLLALLCALLLTALYWRSRLTKCISAAYSYLEDGGERSTRDAYKKPVGSSPRSACTATQSPAGDAGVVCGGRPPRMSAAPHPAVRAQLFPSHVAKLHADGDIGFSKEYEIVVTRSAALGHTSHHSHRPENKHKNRYLNITAYDHSRVCVGGAGAGSRCGAAGCAGAAHCDYVNANFIDGMLPCLDDDRRQYISRKLDARNKPQRQPSIKPAKPPPNLAEGIESAFLNIEFSGIVESEEQVNNESESDQSDDDDESLDDVYIDLDGQPTRVKLEWLVWRRRYIATQGPTPATLPSFWRMIWQHRVHTLVMITNLVERGRRKCDMYWPGGGRGSSTEFGSIHITLLHEDVRAAYTVRHLRVRNLANPGPAGSEPETRTIVQYHYTVWPDHGTPQHPLAVLPFVKAASTDPHTVLVHCSAGVGRTGTYIVLDAQMAQLKLTGTLAPLGFLCRARTQRNHLVQTEEQYVFVHDALLEHVRSGNTAVEFAKAKEYLINLLEPISQEELAVLESSNKRMQSTMDLINGYENINGGSMSSVQAKNGDDTSYSQSEDVKTVDEVMINGSQESLKTDANSLKTDRNSLKIDRNSIKDKNSVKLDRRSLQISPQNSPQMENSYKNGLSNEQNSVKTDRNSLNNDQNSLKTDRNSMNTDQNSLKTDRNSMNTDQNSLKTDRNSMKTDEDSSQNSKSVSTKDLTNGTDNGSHESRKDMVNGDVEGVYDLAHRNSDTYSKKMQAYNNMSEEEKEEIRRVNRAENFALLERMRSLAGRNMQYQGPPPVNLLEKQYQLIARCSAEPAIAARAPHNAEKNRPGGILPSDTARVMLVPKAGIEGSEYINASWVWGRRRLREFAVTQHPPAAAVPDLWRLLWDHTAQMLLVLTEPDEQDCEVFWPTEDSKELYTGNFKASFISKETYIAYRKCDRPKPPTPPESEVSACYRRQESTEFADDERLIPENGSPVVETDNSTYRRDQVELRLEKLHSGSRDLSTRKSIANGDLFPSLVEARKDPKSPKSPSKMSLKNFKLSPTRFKLPDWGRRGCGSPPAMAPPPPPVAPSMTVEEECELHRPCYYFEKVDLSSDSLDLDGITSDRIIEVLNISMHSLQDDYQLTNKIIKCTGWFQGETTKYLAGKPDENPLIREIRCCENEDVKNQAVDKLTEPFKDSFALVEFVAGLQMEYKNGPVVVVDKYGGDRAMSFCTLSAACGGACIADPDFRAPSDDTADLYCWAALSAHARASIPSSVQIAPSLSHSMLLAKYAALERYSRLLVAARESEKTEPR